MTGELRLEQSCRWLLRDFRSMRSTSMGVPELRGRFGRDCVTGERFLVLDEFVIARWICVCVCFFWFFGGIM